MDSSAFSDWLRQPLTIGKRLLRNRLILAPMTGLGHVAFRELIAEIGGHGLLYTEMCSAKALPKENRWESPVFRWRDRELSYLVGQLLGDDPASLAAAAARVEAEGFFGVDINMGCSVAGICKKNCGAALLKSPELAARIIETVRRAVTIPLLVKFRTGWKDDPDYAVMLARQFEAAGADALIYHPRVAPDRRSRPPRWDYIKLVSQQVAIPVIGNGNVFDHNDGIRMATTTGCDGIALGRIAIAQPWIFARWTQGEEPTSATFLEIPLRLTHLLEKHFEPVRAVKLFKKYAIYLSANFLFGHDIYRRLCRADTMEDIRHNIRQLFDPLPVTTARPNMNMFTR